jgi:hypothetical protein
MFFKEAGDFLQFMRTEAAVARQTHGSEPELGLKPFPIHMHMRRLGHVTGIEPDAEAAEAQDRGHDGVIING